MKNMSTCSSNDSFCIESEGDNLKNTVITGKNDFNKLRTVPPVAFKTANWLVSVTKRQVLWRDVAS